MKLRTLLFVLATPAVALAQPAPSPTPASPDQPPPDTAPPPQWLPGVVDLTAAETAVAGKLTLTMARAVEIAEKTQPSQRIAVASIESAKGRVDSARVAEHPSVTLAGTISAGSKPRGFCDATMTTLCGGFASATYGTSLGASATWKIYDFGLTRARTYEAGESGRAARPSGA